jgi:hypothetical protein
MQSAKICHIKGVRKMFLQSKDEIIIIANNEKIIYIYNNNQSVSIDVENIQAVIRFTPFESKLKEEIVDLRIPGLVSLIQTIKQLLDSKNIIESVTKSGGCSMKISSNKSP